MTVRKGQRRLDGLTGNVISLYAKGMTTGDIQAHLAEIYGTEISRDTITRITDAIVEDMVAWQNRPLDAVYPVILIDAIVVKIRDGQVANRPIYVAMGVNLDGERDVLGMWVGPTGGEGAKFWIGDAHRAPQPWHPRHVHRLLRRAQGAPRGDPGDLAAGRRAAVCRAPRPLEPAVHVARSTGVRCVGSCARSTPPRPWTPPTARFAEFAEHWRDRYPAMIATWERAWADFVPFLEFPVELRQIVYTTNAIESLNARFRKAVRHRGHFPTEQAALKVLYLVATERTTEPSQPDRQDQRLEAAS